MGTVRLSNLAASNTAGLAARRAGRFGFVGLVLVLYAVNFDSGADAGQVA